MDQDEINTYMKLTDTRDAYFIQLLIPPKMFVDLNFTIINLTNNKHRRLNGSKPNATITTKTSSLNENMAIKSYKEILKPIKEMF